MLITQMGRFLSENWLNLYTCILCEKGKENWPTTDTFAFAFDAGRCECSDEKRHIHYNLYQIRK